MNRQDYKDEAVRLLKRAEGNLTSGFSSRTVERLTDIARVYTALAATPDGPVTYPPDDRGYTADLTDDERNEENRRSDEAGEAYGTGFEPRSQ